MVEKTKAGSVMPGYGEEGYTWQTPSAPMGGDVWEPSTDTSSQDQGGGGTPWYETFDPTDAQVQADIAASTVSQPTDTFSGTGGGSEYSGTGSPYFTTGYPDEQFGSTVIPEQKPITQPSDMMVGNLFAYELSKDPKYAKEFQGWTGTGEMQTQGSTYNALTNTLGKIMAVDSKGQMILDSSGNPIFTNFGKKMVDEFQANWDPSNPMDITLPGVFKEMAGDVIEKEKEYFKNTGSSTQGGHGYGYGGGGGSGGGGGYYGDPRTGNPLDRYGNFYTPQANLQQAMVNVHGTPTVFRKRGGIVSLLRLN